MAKLAGGSETITLTLSVVPSSRCTPTVVSAKLLKMRRFLQFLRLAVVATALLAGAWPSPAQTPANNEPRPTAPTGQASVQVSVPAQKPAEAAKTPDASHKPKKVYTEDDFKAKGFHGSYEGAEVDISDINLCDQSCFNQLISGTTFSGREGEQRKELTLQAVENTANDADWQLTLHGYARYRIKACALMEERQAILRAHTDPRNVTRDQIRLEKEYEEKEAELRNESLSYLHQGRLDWRNATGKGALRALEMKFAYYQIGKISNAPCPAPRPQQPVYEQRYYSSENDDDP